MSAHTQRYSLTDESEADLLTVVVTGATKHVVGGM